MKNSRIKSVLVIFGQDLPKKSKKWYQQFDEVIGPKELETLINPGSVQQAYELVNKLSRLALSDGSRLSKLINYQGYELWWMNYESIFNEFCLSYTQYFRLLEHLKDFDKIYLFQPPQPDLFRYFLKAHHRQCIILKRFRLRNLLPFPFGVFLQIVLSFFFLPWLVIKRPEIMLWASDKFAPPHKCDFRMIFIYDELKKKNINFIEFIRSTESWMTVLNHAWQRKRPVFYSAAIIYFLHRLTGLISHSYKVVLESDNSEERFWFLIATHYLSNLRGTVWPILVMKFVLQLIGVKAAIIPSACNRTFHEVLACKLNGIKTVGIQHAVIPEYAFVSDFMPEFDGNLQLSVDKYGLWSEYWKEYYLSHSKAYQPEQLYVSGPMRPLEKEIASIEHPLLKNGLLKVLFISEQLAAPMEVMPHLLSLLSAKDFTLHLKFRPYRDGFENWLKKNQPDILKKVRIFRGTMQQAIAESDVVVGSHSTAVLEALAQLKPFVFFWTNKWGDYFGIRPFDTGGRFFANSPKELIDHIRKSSDTPKEILKQLQERFFGNPYQNGSQWVVEQALEFAKDYGKQQTI